MHTEIYAHTYIYMCIHVFCSMSFCNAPQLEKERGYKAVLTAPVADVATRMAGLRSVPADSRVMPAVRAGS